MREIEIKVRVDNLEGIRSSLKGRGETVTEPVTQHDTVWGVAGAAGGEHNTSPWLRIRTEARGEETKHFFTLKRSVTNQLDSIEYETEVSDRNELKSIIDELGFVLYSDLTKTRQKSKVGDIEICMDRVDGLGEFVEAEKLVEDTADYHATISELWSLLEGFGLSQSDEVRDGYDVLMNRKLGIE